MRKAVLGPSVSREDVVLLLADGADGPYRLDRFRVMKGCFLVAQLGGEEWDQLFNFRAYDYGPFDSSIYGARDSLGQAGLLQILEPGRHETYTLTDAGRGRVCELETIIGKEFADWVRGLGHWVSTRSFSSIAHWVYERYPAYATNSVLKT